MNHKHIVWLKDVHSINTELIGIKGEKLGELIQLGLHVPDGFIITSTSYNQFLRENNLIHIITQLIETINFDIPQTLAYAAAQIKNYIAQASLPPQLIQETFTAYKHLGGILQDAHVTIQSSVTKESQPHSSILFDHVKGEANVLMKVKEIWSSFFSEDLIKYRQEKHIDHFSASVAIIIQSTVIAEKSGTLYTINPETNHKKEMVIKVHTSKNTFQEVLKIDKTTLTSLRGAHDATSEKLVPLGYEAIPSRSAQASHYKIATPVPQLTRKDVIERLAKIGLKLEKYYFFPQEITWALENDTIYILQTKPLTIIPVQPKVNHHELTTTNYELILQGSSIHGGIASGPIRHIKHKIDTKKIRKGDILVLEQSHLDSKTVVKKASALVVKNHIKTPHAAIISSGLGIPAIATNQTDLLKDGDIVTVHGATGEVYRGGFIQPGTHIDTISEAKLHTATKIFVHLENTKSAAAAAAQHVDGVGVIEGKVEEMGSVCKLFTPRPVMYRSTGTQEKLPQELVEIKKIRNKLSLKNIWLLLPMLRTAAELAETKKIVSEAGLYRSPSFKVLLSIDLPAQVLALDTFLKIGIDGIVINADKLSGQMYGSQGASITDEAMLWAIEQIIKTAHKHAITVGIYGKDIVNTPALLEKLVRWGISNMTVLPEAIETTRNQVSALEKKLIS